METETGNPTPDPTPQNEGRAFITEQVKTYAASHKWLVRAGIIGWVAFFGGRIAHLIWQNIAF